MADGDGTPDTSDPNPDGEKGKSGKSGGGLFEAIIAGAVALGAEGIKALANALDGRSIVGEISNNTAFSLVRVADHHESGSFQESPPPEIAPHTPAGFSSQTTAFLQGTVGSVTYAGDGFTVLFGWSNPELGDNKVNTTKEGPNASRIIVFQAAGSGNKGAHMQYWLAPHPDYSVKASLADKAQDGVIRIRPLRPGGATISVREIVST
jgi:hypothetical protein